MGHTPIRASLHDLRKLDQRHSVLVLRAYFDDSGTHNGSPACVWGGFMGHVDEWDEIEDGWSALLKREGLASFHMAEIENACGQCDMWPRARRDSVIHDFRQVLAGRNIIGIASVTWSSGWEQAARGTWIEDRYISPSLFTFEHVIQQALHWAYSAEIQSDISEKVDFVFDLREQEAARGLDAANTYSDAGPFSPWFSSAVFRRMKETIPLQAADLIAYETFRLGCEQSAGHEVSPSDLRAHMYALLRDVPCYGQYYNAEAFRILATQGPHGDLLTPAAQVGS